MVLHPKDVACLKKALGKPSCHPRVGNRDSIPLLLSYLYIVFIPYIELHEMFVLVEP